MKMEHGSFVFTQLHETWYVFLDIVSFFSRYSSFFSRAEETRLELIVVFSRNACFACKDAPRSQQLAVDPRRHSACAQIIVGQGLILSPSI
jgi:hypothetical protein